MNDIIWIHPEHRNFGLGKMFVDFWEEDLKSRGVQLIQMGSKLAHPALGALLIGCGYAPVETVFHKRLR